MDEVDEKVNFNIHFRTNFSHTESKDEKLVFGVIPII